MLFVYLAKLWWKLLRLPRLWSTSDLVKQFDTQHIKINKPPLTLKLMTEIALLRLGDLRWTLCKIVVYGTTWPIIILCTHRQLDWTSGVTRDSVEVLSGVWHSGWEDRLNGQKQAESYNTEIKGIDPHMALLHMPITGLKYLPPQLLMWRVLCSDSPASKAMFPPATPKIVQQSLAQKQLQLRWTLDGAASILPAFREGERMCLKTTKGWHSGKSQG